MALWIGLLVVGIAVFALGWRGWRVGDVPHCRKCGYDLSGIESREACPECGRGLASPKAVRVGRLRRRPVLASVGGVMVVAAIAIAGYQVILTTSNLPPSKRPMWLLTLDTKNSLDSRADEAMAEIHGRWQAGKVSDETFATFFDAALDRHGDPEYDWVWNCPWTYVLDDARSGGLLNDEQFERLRQQYFTGVEMSLFRDRYRMYEDEYPWWFEMELDPYMRLVFDDQLVIIRAWPTRVTLNGEEVEQVVGEQVAIALHPGIPGEYFEGIAGDTGWEVHGMVGQAYSWHWGQALSSVPRPKFTIPMPELGMHHFRADYVIEYFVEDGFENEVFLYLVNAVLPKSEPVRRESVTETFDVHIIADASEVIIPVGPEQGFAEPSIGVTTTKDGTVYTFPLHVHNNEDVGGTYSHGRYYISGILLRKPGPNDLAYGCFDVYLVIDDKRTPVIALHDGEPLTLRLPPVTGTSAPHEARTQLNCAVEYADLPRVDRIDLLLVPNLEFAAGDPNAREVWNEEVILKSIPLNWSEIDEEPSEN